MIRSSDVDCQYCFDWFSNASVQAADNAVYGGQPLRSVTKDSEIFFRCELGERILSQFFTLWDLSKQSNWWESQTWVIGRRDLSLYVFLTCELSGLRVTLVDLSHTYDHVNLFSK